MKLVSSWVQFWLIASESQICVFLIGTRNSGVEIVDTDKIERHMIMFTRKSSWTSNFLEYIEVELSQNCDKQILLTATKLRPSESYQPKNIFDYF